VPAPSPHPDAQQTYYRDVEPLLARKCVGCHQDGGIAPFSLGTPEAAAAVKGQIKAAVTERTMPPWLAAEGCSEYLHDRSLTDEEIATLSDWVDLGAPAGDPKDHQEPAPEAKSLTRVDRTLSMPETYTATKEPDDYRCFLIDWPEDEATFVTGLRVNPGAASVVHHVIAFLVSPDRAADYEALDASEEGPGYTCFGGPGGGNDSSTGWIGAWAPGSGGGDFPEGTGLKVLPGSKIALQVHYNTANGKAPDKTSIDLKLDASVAHEAKWQFFADINWIFGDGMHIDAGDPDATHAYAVDPTPFISDGKPFVIHDVGLHMHLRGTQASFEIKRAGGGDECMLDIPNWNFHWQNSYELSEPKPFSPGDQLAIECHWDNSPANQPVIDGAQVPPKDLAWGEGTGDEMCLGALYISEP